LVRDCEEITVEYVEGFMSYSRESGIELVAMDNSTGDIVGELHAYRLGLKVFNHVLGNLTIVIDPQFQGRGIGRSLFDAFFSWVEKEKPEILRIELIVRETNKRAIGLYESLGFQIEGKMERRILGVTGELEADIPMVWVRSAINYQ
jgi:putative acetyltransferase